MPHLLFFKKRQNLQLSSSASYRWGFNGQISFQHFCRLNKTSFSFGHSECIKNDSVGLTVIRARSGLNRDNSVPERILNMFILKKISRQQKFRKKYPACKELNISI